MHIKSRTPQNGYDFFLTCISMSMLKNSLGILGLDYGVVVANYNPEGPSEVESLVLSNVHDGDVTVDMRFVRDEEVVSVLKSATIRKGGNILPFAGKEKIFNLQAGDVLEARCSVEGGVHFACSWSGADIDFSDYQSTFNQFLEIDVPNGMTLSSEKLVVLIKDSQLSTRIDIVDRNENLSECYEFAHWDPCPQGYEFAGNVDECDSPCDKLCCPTVNPDAEAMICGMVYPVAKEYNTPWSFHLSPESVRLAFQYDLSSELMNITLQSIQDSLGDIPPGGREYCFPLKGRTRSMDIVGPFYCESPLLLEATKIFDEDLGKYVQQTVCDGDCENISGSSCLDAEINAYSAYLDSLTDEVEETIDAMDYEQLVDYLFEELGSLDDEPDAPSNLEEFEEVIMGWLSSSSSSEVPLEESPVVFDDETDALSTNPEIPSPISLKVGENYIVSVTGGGFEETYFSFEIGQGKKLSEVSALMWGSPVGMANVAIKTGTSWDSQEAIADSDFGPGIDKRLLLSEMPLGQGQYTLKISSTGQEVGYAILLLVEETTAGET